MVSRPYTALAVLALFAVILAAPAATAQTKYTISVKTDASSYSPGQQIKISGAVSPAPGASTGVAIRIFNPSGSLVDAAEAFPDAATGGYNYTTVAGGSSDWTPGTYTVNATWGAFPPTVSNSTTFAYSATVTTTTSTTSTTSSTSSSTTTSTSSTTTSTTSSESTTTSSTTSTTQTATTSSSTSTTPVPEFPYQAAFVAVFLAVIVVAYLMMREAKGSASSGLRTGLAVGRPS